MPLKEDQYKIIHLKEPDFLSGGAISDKDKYNYLKDLPELKANNVLKRITLTFTYFSDINSVYIKEETIFKDIQVIFLIFCEFFEKFQFFSIFFKKINKLIKLIKFRLWMDWKLKILT